MPAPKSSTARRRALAKGYRSGLEDTVSSSLLRRGCPATYESHTVPYTVPERVAKYTPDFVLPNGIVVETKGLWETDDRKKIELVREQYPALDLRIVFTNPNTKIRKGSPTSYAMICTKLGIPYAAKDVPQAWLDEPPNIASLMLLQELAK